VSSRGRTGKHLPLFSPVLRGLKQGNGLARLFFKFYSRMCHEESQRKSEKADTEWTQVLNILNEIISNTNSNTEMFLQANKEFGLEVIFLKGTYSPLRTFGLP
jgi:hypothetical protein